MTKKTPRYYQTEAVNTCVEAIRKALTDSKASNNIVDAGPGSGKTLMMAMLANHVASRGGNVLILSRQPVLCGQNYDECWEYEVAAGMYAAKYNRKQINSNVIVATEGTIVNALHTDFKNHRFDLICIDECHMVDYTEEKSQFMKIITHFTNNAKRIGSKLPLQIVGMTGSPYRGTESIIGKFWGDRVYDIGTIELTERGFLTPPIYGFADEAEDLDFSSVNMNITEYGTEESFSESELDEIVMGSDGKKRLVHILKEVIVKTRSRQQAIIFASTQRHAREIKKVFGSPWRGY